MRKWRSSLIALPILTAALYALAALGIRYASDLLLWAARLGGRTPGADTETIADVLAGFHKGTIQPLLPAVILCAALPAACLARWRNCRTAGRPLLAFGALLLFVLALAATLLLTRINDIRLWDALRSLWPMRGSIGALL